MEPFTVRPSRSLERWLDAGRPEVEAEGHRTHAAGCARYAPARAFASRETLVRWSLGGLGIGAAAWGAVEALSSSAAAELAAKVVGPGLQRPDGMAALVVLSTLAAGLLTWASLRLARAVEHAALRA